MTKYIFSLFLCLPLVAAADYKIEEVKLPKQIVVTRQMEGNPSDAGKLIASALADVNKFMKEKKLTSPGKPFVRTLEWTPTRWTFEAGLPISKKTKGNADIKVTDVPVTRALKTEHIGAVDKTKEAFAALAAAMPQHKVEKDGPHWVVYMSDAETTKKEDMRTEVYFPVKPIAAAPAPKK